MKKDFIDNITIVKVIFILVNPLMFLLQFQLS